MSYALKSSLPFGFVHDNTTFPFSLFSNVTSSTAFKVLTVTSADSLAGEFVDEPSSAPFTTTETLYVPFAFISSEKSTPLSVTVFSLTAEPSLYNVATYVFPVSDHVNLASEVFVKSGATTSFNAFSASTFAASLAITASLIADCEPYWFSTT